MSKLLKLLDLAKDEHALVVFNNSGDTVTKYNPNDPKAVAAVKAEFDSLINDKKAWALAGADTSVAETTEFTRTFDPAARVHEVHAQIAGG